MPTAHITVTAVTDEGDTVIVWGRPGDAPGDAEPDGYVFQSKGVHDTVSLAEEASRVAAGTAAIIDHTPVVDGWHVASGLTVPPADEWWRPRVAVPGVARWLLSEPPTPPPTPQERARSDCVLSRPTPDRCALSTSGSR